MFDAEPMPAAMLATLWPMAAEVGWERKWAIVSLVGSFPEGTWLDGADVATIVGGNAARARVQLQLLAQARVLERDGGGGDRKFWYRVNPCWRQWRVRWRHDLREVEQRLAWWEKRAMQHPLDAISARPNGARYSQISARLMARAAAEWARANDPLARLPMARANSDFGPVDNGADQLARAIETRANGVDSARHGARANPPAAPEEVDLLARDGENPSTSEPPGRPSDGPEWKAVRRAVLERSVDVRGKGLFLNGPPARTLRVLLAHHGLNATLEAIAAVPPGLFGPPLFVEAVGDVLDGLTLTSAPAPAGDTETGARLTAEAKLARVRQQVANYRSFGAEVPEDLQAELDELLAHVGDQLQLHPEPIA